TEWSAWAVRSFATAAATAVLPLELEDVASAPAPTWNDRFGVPVVLPAATTPTTAPPRLLLESSAGSLVLEIDGDHGSANRIVNPPDLGYHIDTRVHILAGSAQLALPESDLTFTDDHGISHTIYLPAVSLSAGQEAFYWVSAGGSSYVGQAAQTQPDFS